jgi:N-acetyl-anhydromuramoyl-L-alanine amidase
MAKAGVPQLPVIFAESDRLSPNFAAQPEHEQLGVCFHHSVLGFEDALSRLTDPASRVSYHVLIELDGTRARLVADTHVAWHAGVSQFHGRDSCNAFLLGVAFAGDTYVHPLTEPQIASALEWLSLRWTRRGWSIEWMTDHRQIAPGRKDDLNPVEWLRLRTRLEPQFGGCH